MALQTVELRGLYDLKVFVVCLRLLGDVTYAHVFACLHYRSLLEAFRIATLISCLLGG